MGITNKIKNELKELALFATIIAIGVLYILMIIALELVQNLSKDAFEDAKDEKVACDGGEPGA